MPDNNVNNLNDIKHSLVDSCGSLNADHNILNLEQVKQCRESILGVSGTKDEFEMNTFDEDRDNKLNVYYEAINQIADRFIDNQRLIDAGDVACVADADADADASVGAVANAVANAAAYACADNNKLKNIIDDFNTMLDKIVVDRYKNNEYSQYNTLLDYYNRIDNNRKKEVSKNGSINTLNKVLFNEQDKLTQTTYTLRLIVLIILIVICIILILLFIKF
jgi:hypothetical protein